MRTAARRSIFSATLVAACVTLVQADRSPQAAAPASTQPAASVALPHAEGSLKFAVLGDFGTGDKPQYALAETMAKVHETFPYELVVLVGDNIYGSDRPQDYEKKFERPYKPLLDAGVKFYGSLGNHDAREQRFYKLFNMDGKLYYSFKAPKQDVRFIALESSYMQPEQIKWLEEALSSAREEWKIVFFHHPLYSSGLTHGSDDRLRAVLEPLFIKHGVSLVLNGHDHIYERSKPQHAITYFVTGSGGKLREDGARQGLSFSSTIVDDTHVFLTVELEKDALVFNAIATGGKVVDSGRLERVKKSEAGSATSSPARPAGIGQ
jgi:predicted MPP superfamily phosphohydrolase